MTNVGIQSPIVIRYCCALSVLCSVLLSSTCHAQLQASGDPWYRKLNDTYFRMNVPYVSANGQNKVIEVDSGVFSDNTKVQVYDAYAQNGLASGQVQEWLYIPAGRVGTDMTYRIMNRFYGTYLDSAPVNGQVKVKPFNGGLSQRWIFLAHPGGGYCLMSASTGNILSFLNSANGSALTMRTLSFAASQKATPVMTSAPSPLIPNDWNYVRPYSIHANDSLAMVLTDMTSSGGQNSSVGLQANAGGAPQHWVPQAAYGDPNMSFEDTFNLYRQFTGLKLAPFENQLNSGTSAVLRFAEPEPATMQRWYSMPARSGYYLIHAATGFALQRSSNANGATVSLVPASADSRQFWSYTRL